MRDNDILEKIKELNKSYRIWLVLLVLLIPISSASMYFWFYVDPEVNMNMVSGTEYIAGEDGQLILRLTDSDGNAMSGVSCKANALYPDKTYFIMDKDMIESTEAGNYFYKFTPPGITGIYEYTLKCSFIQRGRIVTKTVSHSFHISPALIEMIRQLNATQVQLEQTKNELALLMNQMNESLDTSIGEKIKADTEEENQKMADLGKSISEIFTS